MVPLAGKPLLEHLLERLSGFLGKDKVVLATSESAENQVLLETAARLGIASFAGDEEDVLGRHLAVAKRFDAGHVVRVTGKRP